MTAESDEGTGSPGQQPPRTDPDGTGSAGPGQAGGSGQHSDNLHSSTRLRIYGVPFNGLALGGPEDNRSAPPSDRPLDKLLAREDCALARVYAFTFEGVFYMLPRPCVYVVRGSGTEGASGSDGLAARDWLLSSGMRAWDVDAEDLTVRIDTEAGSFEDVLLDAVAGGGDLSSRAELASRAELVSRAEMLSRHRMKR